MSPNCSKPRNASIDRITIHCLVGQWTAEQIGDYFSRDVQASCNYGIGKAGDIVCCVAEEHRSWCSSSAANDNRAITIETASDTFHPYKVTDAAFAALLDLCEDICRRYGKKKLLWIHDKEKALAYKPAADEMILTVHRWFANKACPGDYLFSRHAEIAATVTERLGEEMTYKKIEDMPEVYRPTIQKLVDRGIIKGTEDGLDLTRNMARLLVYIDRAGVFDYGTDSR